MGFRAATMANLFTRYRFKYIRFKWMASSATVAYSSIGVYDEGGSSEGSAPPVSVDILELRASSSQLVNQTTPNFFEWRPVDTSLWMYNIVGLAGSDTRLSVSGVLFGGSSTASTAVAIEVDYSLVFKGAVDTGSL